ncbi:MAG: hypothetical protein ACYS76_10025 [Planctomycetota bacterium]|jgi:predicted nucleotidyltransferase
MGITEVIGEQRAQMMELQVLLHRRVDIVTEKGLRWYIRDKVLEEAKSV